MKNERRKNILTIVLLWVIAAAVIAVMFAFYFTLVAPRPQKGQKTVTLELAYANKTFTYEDIVTETDTVFAFLKEQNEPLNLRLVYEDGAFGPYVTGMMDVAEDSGRGYYYTFLVNGQSAPVGVGSQTLKSGDVIRFEYGVSVFDEATGNWTVELMGAGKGSAPVSRRSVLIIFIVLAAAMPAVLVVYTVHAYRKRKKAANESAK